MPMFETPIPAYGPDGNIFAMLGRASTMLRQLGRDIDAALLEHDVMASESYAQACALIEEWFPLDRGEQ